METPQLVELLENGEEEDVRGEIFTLSGDNIEDQPLFPHQMQSIHNIYENNNESGIIRYPTGGGKTRTAIAYMAKEMQRCDNRKFLWATYPRDVLRQGMLRLAELAGEFEDDIKFTWWDRQLMQGVRPLLDGVDIVFVMRDHLTEMFRYSLDGRVQNSLMLRAFDPDEDEEEVDLSLIYDECHQLGADKLQEHWMKFTREHDCSLHTIGFSATPIPTKPEDSIFLQDEIFQIKPGTDSERPEWGMLCHHDVRTSYLQEKGVLCEVDKKWEDKESFNLTVQCPHISPPPPNPSDKQINEFVEQFNRSAMAHPSVIENLSKDIAENIEELGKTIVFVPTIGIANALLSEMEGYDSLQGRCTMVHSKLGEFVDDEEDVDIIDRNKQVQKFKERGSDPCVMLNVGMLTTGFDDPNIRSVVLARLTTSTNLFWQMLGRGMRGPEVGGTKSVSVIDPIRLSEKHQAVNGYRATIEDACGEYAKMLELDPDDLVKEIISDTKEDEVPDDNGIEYSEEFQESVRRALTSFVSYDQFKKAIDQSEWSEIGWCHKLIKQAEDSLNTDLDWMRNDDFMPDSSSDIDLHAFHRKVEVCRDKGIKTKDGWKQHLMSVL